MSTQPTHRIYQIEDRGENNKPFWREVGVAWQNQDGSLNLKFAVTPNFAEHTAQVRKYEAKPETSEDSTPTPRSRRSK